MNTEENIWTADSIRDSFPGLLDYLIRFYGVRGSAKILGVSPSTISRLHTSKQLPSDEALLFKVWAEAIVLLGTDELRQRVLATMDKVEEAYEKTLGYKNTLSGAIDYLKSPGETYEEVANRLNDTLPDSVEGRSLSNWHKGNQPWQRSAADYFKESPLHKSMKRHKVKMPGKVESAIIGAAARKIGLNDLRYYALFPLFERFEAIPQFADTVKQWRKWCTEYEKRQAQRAV